MKKKTYIICISTLLIFSLMGCSGQKMEMHNGQGNEKDSESISSDESNHLHVSVSEDVTELERGLSIAEYDGDYKFDTFLSNGGAKSDKDVLTFLIDSGLVNLGMSFSIPGFGCSTISVPAMDGNGYLFGRNFDWNKCNALIMVSRPDSGYASISTVNTDFIKQAAGIPLTDPILKTAAIYAPLDGMNEMGLCVTVNMIQDNDTINQNTDKPDITTTTAIRLLLDNAANVDEAIELLESYDMHASFGYMVHFAIADADGRAVAVEYIGGGMSVVETPILTNFYVTAGDKYGIGTSQSHTRFEILESKLSDNPVMSEALVKDALSSVSKGNFGEFESTEWSIVFNQEDKTATYYHRENYDQAYTVSLER